MTITIRLPEELETRLRTRLDAEQTPLSEFVREAIAEKLERDVPAKKRSAYEVGKHLFGKYSSGRTDVAENAEQILREMLIAKNRR